MNQDFLLRQVERRAFLEGSRGDLVRSQERMGLDVFEGSCEDLADAFTNCDSFTVGNDGLVGVVSLPRLDGIMRFPRRKRILQIRALSAANWLSMINCECGEYAISMKIQGCVTS